MMKEQKQLREDRKYHSKEWPIVAIIIPNWNGWHDTIECLESLQQLTYPHYQVIVVDNGSTNDSIDKIKQWCEGMIPVNTNFVKFSPELKPVKFIEYDKVTAKAGGITYRESKIKQYLPNRKLIIIHAGENLGFCDGNNIGIEYALNKIPPADFIFLLNNDTWIEPSCITFCVKVALKESAGIVGAVPKTMDGHTILLGDARFPWSLFYSSHKISFPSELPDSWNRDAASGVGMLIRSDLLYKQKLKFGFFLNPDLFMYWDETDFCLRAKRLGYKTYIAGKSIIYHKISNSTFDQGRTLRYYYITRNCFLMARKWLPFYSRLIFYICYPLICFIRTIKKLIQGERMASAIILKGLKDGFLGIRGKWECHDKYANKKIAE